LFTYTLIQHTQYLIQAAVVKRVLDACGVAGTSLDSAHKAFDEDVSALILNHLVAFSKFLAHLKIGLRVESLEFSLATLFNFGMAVGAISRSMPRFNSDVKVQQPCQGQTAPWHRCLTLALLLNLGMAV
jgi:hypothetical protein